MKPVCILALATLTWSLSGCPAENNPCSGVDCSDHGFCGVTPHGTPLCLCDEGYRNDGPTECVPDEGADCTSDADCDDSNPCTDDTCDTQAGCHYTNNTDSCDDGNPCSSADTCSNGTCMAGGTDKDGDQDGYYDAACPGGNDCRDGDPNVHPDAVEGLSDPQSCNDGIDNDCDNLTDGEDASCQDPTGIYYVRTDGDNNNSGTENTPQGAWRDIQKAAETLAAGETVLVQAGTYNEEVYPQNSGQDTQPITYQAEGHVILDGQDSLGYAFHLDQKHYIVIDGFEMTDYRDVAGDDGTIFIGNTSTHNTVRNCYIHDTGRDCIAIYRNGDNNLVENCLLVDCDDDGITPDGDSIVIKNCTIYGTGEWGIEQQGGSNTVFENNIIWDAISDTGSQYTWRYNNHRDSVLTGDGNLSQDPLFIDISNRDFRLSHTAAGQDADSPCIDAGSDTAQNLGLDSRTTRTDGVTDTGTVDLGYHYLP